MNYQRPLTTILGISAISAAFFAAPAGAVGGVNENTRTKCVAAIDKRFATLDELTQTVANSTYLSDANRSTLNDDISSTRSGLENLKVTIQADADNETLRADCKKIATDYRVYKLVAPTVHIVNAGDRGLTASAKFGPANEALTEGIAAAQAAGVDQAKIDQAVALQASANAKVADGTGKIPGIQNTVIALTPADVNAGTSDAVLDQARNDLRAIRTQLVSARDDMKAAAAALRS